MSQSEKHETNYLTMSEVAARFHRSKRAIYRWMEDRNFPPPALPSAGGAENLFLRCQVEEWERIEHAKAGWKALPAAEGDEKSDSEEAA